MTGWIYFANVVLHVLSAMLWLGGMLFLGVVGAPVLRGVEPPELRQQLFHQLGVRFRSIGWAAIVVLVVTGTLNLYFRGWLSWDVWTSVPFWRSAYGHALAVKLAAVTIMIVLSAFHDFSMGPRAGRATPGSPEALLLRRRAAMFGRVNALIGLVVVIAAARLAR